MPNPLAAHPETLRIVQTVHDTVYVVVRDTIVRVAESSHEPVKSAGFFGGMSTFDIIVAIVALAASVATIVVAILAIRAYVDARRKARNHLRAHIGIVRNWIQGPSPTGPPTGWSPNDVTPQTALKWRHPRYQQVPLFSGTALSQVTLLQNVFLPESLTTPLAAVAQSVESFNDAIAQYNAFKMSDPLMFISVERKLDAGSTSVFGTASPPPNMTPADLHAVLNAASLTPDEAAWADNLFHMLMHAHVTFIGNSTGRGLFRRLQDLETEFAAHA